MEAVNEHAELDEWMEDEEENDGVPLSDDEVQWMINRSMETATEEEEDDDSNVSGAFDWTSVLEADHDPTTFNDLS
jgi:outer membrane lipoprotein-sorting protein